VIQVQQEVQVQMEKREDREERDQLVQKDPQARKDPQDLRDHLDHQEPTKSLLDLLRVAVTVKDQDQQDPSKLGQ